MKLLKNKLVPAALIATLLFSTPVSSVNAADDIDFTYMLEKVADIDDSDLRELGMGLIKSHLDNDNPDITALQDDLKWAIDTDPTGSIKKQIRDAGTDVGTVISKLSVLEEMSASEIKAIVNAISDSELSPSELTNLNKIAEKYDNLENKNNSGGTSGSSSGGSSTTSGGTVIATIPAVGQTNIQLKDVQNHWAKETILELYSKGIIKGQTEDSFNPDGSITRAEFTALIVRALGIEGTGTESFTDVNPSDWFYSVVSAAKSSGIINGITQSSFAPNEKVTREQMVKIIIGALEYKGKKFEGAGSVGDYADGSQVSTWASDSMGKALGAGVIKGQSASHIAPKADAKRAEAAVIIKRVLDIK